MGRPANGVTISDALSRGIVCAKKTYLQLSGKQELDPALDRQVRNGKFPAFDRVWKIVNSYDPDSNKNVDTWYLQAITESVVLEYLIGDNAEWLAKFDFF